MQIAKVIISSVYQQLASLKFNFYFINLETHKRTFHDKE